MNRSHLEIAKLKALKVFGEALHKSYEDWTEEESRACAILDAAWRIEHGYREEPDDDDHNALLGKMFNGKRAKGFAYFKQGIDSAAGVWLKENNNSHSFLIKFHQGICKFWDSVRSTFGFKKDDDVSPFEAIRTMKIIESPKFTDIAALQDEFKSIKEKDYLKKDYVRELPERNEWFGVPSDIQDKYKKLYADIEQKKETAFAQNDNPEKKWEIQQNYDKEMREAKAAFRKDMVIANPLHKDAFRQIYENRNLSLALYTKTFMQAIERPYSRWTKAERDACSILDAIWRRDRDLPSTGDFDSQEHWQKLNKKIMKMPESKQREWEREVAKIARTDDIQTAHKHLDKVSAKFFGGSILNGTKNEFSPFEAIRMRKMLSDPDIGMEEAINELEEYSLGQAAGSLPKYTSGLKPQEVQDGQFDGSPYKSITSEAYKEYMANPEKKQEGIEPVEVKLEGLQNKVIVRCMSNEKAAIMDAFILSMGQTNIIPCQCENMSNIILNSLYENKGEFANGITANGDPIGSVDAKSGQALMQKQTLETDVKPEVKPVSLEKQEEKPAEKEQQDNNTDLDWEWENSPSQNVSMSM